MKIKLMLLLIAILAMTACKKENSLSSSEILTSQDWRITSRITDGLEDLDDCEKDDKITFSSEGIYNVAPGDLGCNIELDTGLPWSLNSEETILTVGGFIFEMNMNILSLTEDEMVLEGEVEFFGDVTNAKLTFAPF